MGGDHAPHATLEGACLAAETLAKNSKIVLIGNQDIANEWLSKNGVDSSLFDFIHASETIEMNEHATKALRKKPNNSISIGFNALKNKEVVI